jgi:hypothetical protein
LSSRNQPDIIAGGRCAAPAGLAGEGFLCVTKRDAGLEIPPRGACHETDRIISVKTMSDNQDEIRVPPVRFFGLAESNSELSDKTEQKNCEFINKITLEWIL